MAATHIVVRSFPGPGGTQMVAGTKVDASKIRNTEALVRRRYLRPILAGEASTPTEAPAEDAAPRRGKR